MTTDFPNLMARLRRGDGDAATEVVRRYAQRLVALARGRLDRVIRTKVDPEDVMQSVYASFFRRQAEGDFELDDWDGLWALLAVITLRKCGHRAEYFHAAMRDVRRESEGAELPAADPTPSHAAMLTETVEALMRDLDGRERDMLALSLQGHDTAAISAEVGRTERTVQRVLKKVRERLEAMGAG